MSNDASSVLDDPRSSHLPGVNRMSGWPWWLLVAVGLGLVFSYKIITDDDLTVIFKAVAKGLPVTLGVTFSAYGLALIIGLIVGLGRVSKNAVIYNVATFYVEIVRGIPMLVLLMYIAFVAVPMGVDALNNLGEWLLGLGVSGAGTWLAELSTRNFSNTMRVTLGLGVAYGAFSAEIYRAGIESIEKGQREAARALGMSYAQSMRYVILPQAIRRVLPALGNDVVAMVKDSSLVSVLGVQDMTQLAKLYAASTFLFFQTYTILAFLYLIVTISLTRIVRWLERRLSRDRR